LNVDLQLCMSTPRHYLHSLTMPNVTTLRTSQDRFGSTRWTDFLYSSRFASAMGIWPFTDVFMSAETRNMVLAVLSGGPVGVGDAIGSLNSKNLMSAARADGVIVKPDVPLAPTDASFFSHAGGDMTQPMVASTYSAFGSLKATYIVGYDQGTGSYPALKFSDFGLAATGYLYDYLADSATQVHAADAYPMPANGFSYTVLVPTGPSGITLLGDRHQFAAFGKQRITAFSDDGTVHVTVAFAPAETTRTLHGISAVEPQIRMYAGRLIHSTYDPATQRFALQVGPNSQGKATVEVLPGHTVSHPCASQNCKVL
jgi:hypothetical protein